MKHLWVRLSAVAIVLFMGSIAYAADQTGAIKGVVRGPDGTALPGISVTIQSEKLMGDRQLTTDEKGFYRFIALPPGTYEVIATGSGYLGQVKQTQVHISRTSPIDFALTVPEAEEQEIIVTEERPTIDPEQTNVGEVISDEMLHNLPTSRSYQGVAQLVPGVVGGSNPNIKGGSYDENAWMIDGVNTSDPVTNTFSSNFNYEAIDQLEVVTNGFDGENQTMGGVINIVTKSGGNNFEGGIASFFEDDAQFEFLSPKRPHNCAEYTSNYVPTDSDLEDQDNCSDVIESSEAGRTFKAYDTNLWLGGPIVKDKLWFFTSYTFQQSIAQARGVQLPRVFTGHYMLGKLTWQVTPSHKSTFQYQSDPAIINRIIQSRFTLPEAEAQQVQSGYFAQAKHEWFARSDLLLEGQVFQQTVNIDVTPSPRDDGSIDLSTPGTLGFGGAYSRGNFYSYDFNRRSRSTARLKATYFKDNLLGAHEFGAGIDATRLVMDRSIGSPGDIRFNTVCDPIGECEGGNGAEVDYYTVEFTGPINVRNTANVFGWWLQDKWKPISNLVVQPILRFDSGAFYNDDGSKVIDYFALSPRFHFAWDPLSDGKTNVRGGYGRSIDPGKLSLSNFMNAHGRGAKLFLGDYFGTSAGTLYLQDDGEATTVRAPNLTYPRTDEIFLGVERDVYRGLAVGVIYTGKWQRYLFEDDDSNVIWNGAGTNIIGTRRGIEDYRFRIRTPRDATRFYQGVDFTIRKRFSDSFNILGSYTFSKTTGTTSSNYTAALDNDEQRQFDFGFMPWDRTHQLKLQGSYEFPMGLVLGATFGARSGLPYDRFVWNDWDFGYSNRTASRGSFGRSPGIYTADLRVAYRYRLPGRYGNLEAVLDIFNITNNRQVAGYQGGYLNTYGEGCNSAGECEDLLRPSGRVAPMAGRFGLKYNF